MPTFTELLKAFKPASEAADIALGPASPAALGKDSLAYENAVKFLQSQGTQPSGAKGFDVKTAMEAGWKPADVKLTASAKKKFYEQQELTWKPVQKPAFVPPPGGEQFAADWKKSGSVGGHLQPTAKQVADYTSAYEQQGKPVSFMDVVKGKTQPGSFMDVVKGKTPEQLWWEAKQAQTKATKQPLPPSYDEQLALAKKLEANIANKKFAGMQVPDGATIAAPEGWTYVGGQMGSNKGGLFADPTGQKWYVKNLQSVDHARNETMVNRLYAAVGADVSDVEMDGYQVRSKIISDAPTLKQLKAQKGDVPLPVKQEIRKNFAADAWLNNWDVIGTGMDNILVDPKSGKTFRIDTGGGLKYRAQGKPKTSRGLYYSADAVEVDSLRGKPFKDPYGHSQQLNNDATAIFKDMTSDQLVESAARLAKIKPEQIAEIVKQYGPTDPKAQANLTKLLIRRRDNVVARITNPHTPGIDKMPLEARKAAWAKGDPTMESWHGLGGPFSGTSLAVTSQEGGFWTTPAKELARMYAASGKTFNWNLATGEQQGHMAEFVTNIADYKRIDAKGKSFGSINESEIRRAREAYYPGIVVDNVWDEPAVGSKQLGKPQTVVITLDPTTQRIKGARFDPAKASLNDLVASGAAIALPPALAYSIFGTGEARAQNVSSPDQSPHNIPMTDGQDTKPKFRTIPLGERDFQVPADMPEEEAQAYVKQTAKKMDMAAGVPQPDTSFKGEMQQQEKEAGESLVSGFRAMFGHDETGKPIVPEEPPDWVKRLAKDNGQEFTAAEKRSWQIIAGAGAAAAGIFQAALSVPVAAAHTLIDRSNESDETKAALKQIVDMGMPAGGLGVAMKTSKFIKAAQASQSLSKIGKVRDGIKAIMSPDKVDADSRASAALIREKTGEAARETATTSAAIKEDYKGATVGAVKNIWQNYERRINAMTPTDQRKLIEYMQTRSKGAVLHDPELQAFADEFRNAMEQREIKLSQVPKLAATHMQEDYVTQYWKDPQAAQKFVNQWVGKQGSGASLKKKKWPTYEDGIKAGLEPLTTNPIEIARRYVTSMDRFIAHNEILEAGRSAGKVKFFSPGGKLAKRYEADGWVQLDGHLAVKHIPKTGKELRAYAPDHFALPYNNAVSKGIYGRDRLGISARVWGNAYDAFKNASNALTQLVLGFSGYHLLNIAWEAVASPAALVVSQTAGAVQKGAKGDVLGALKLLGGAGKTAGLMLTRPVTGAVRGHKLEQIYLNRIPATRAFDRDLVDLFTKAGGRLGRLSSPDYTLSAAGSWFDAFKRGTFLKDIKEDFSLPGPLGKTRALGRQVGKIMQTVVQPIFEKYVPKMKMAAFSENMSAWIAANPLASDAEKAAVARKILDSIDNRFGELIQDNLFWAAGMRQAANVGLLAFSWTYGTIREVGGGALAGMKNPSAISLAAEKYDPRVGYIIGLPMAAFLVGNIYTALKTGAPPKDLDDALDNTFAPKTGGTSPGVGGRGEVPERAALPGNIKDIMGWWNDARAEAYNKLGPGAKIALDMVLTGRDWKGGHINVHDWSDVPGWVGDYFDYLQQFQPIGVQSAERGLKRGSHLGGVESSVFGVRPAPMYQQDPEGMARFKERSLRLERLRRQRSENRQQNLYGGPNE